MSSRTGRKSPPHKQSSQSQSARKQKQSQQAQRPEGTRPQTPTKSYPPKPQVSKTAQASQTQEVRKLSHQERQAAARVAAARRRRIASLRRIGIFSAIAIVLVFAAGALIVREATRPGQLIDSQPSNHIAYNPGNPPAYNTDPPTSGPHVGEVPQFKVYTEPMTKELQVHGLEDGGVIVNYRPDLDKAQVDRLASITTVYLEQPSPKNRVVMSPYANLSNPIVLTAWRRIERLDTFDEATIRRFIDEYVGVDRHRESRS